jgi:hypothetical protein
MHASISIHITNYLKPFESSPNHHLPFFSTPASFSPWTKFTIATPSLFVFSVWREKDGIHAKSCQKFV